MRENIDLLLAVHHLVEFAAREGLVLDRPATRITGHSAPDFFIRMSK